MLTPPEIETTLKLVQTSSRLPARRVAVAALSPLARDVGFPIVGLRADVRRIQKISSTILIIMCCGYRLGRPRRR